MNPEDEAEEDGANIDLDSQRKGKCVVLKTSTRQVIGSILFYSYLRTHFRIVKQRKYIFLIQQKN
jgi:hypothetical protein